jgi:two-component system, cell cycle sensor histidine kinase and response regulator CckA
MNDSAPPAAPAEARTGKAAGSLLDRLEVGVVVSDRNAIPVEANRAALALLDVLPEEMGRAIDLAERLLREDGSPMPPDERPSRRAAATGQPVRSAVMGVFRPRHGDRIFLLVDAIPELDAGGQVARVVSTLCDLTTRRRDEEVRLVQQAQETAARMADGIAQEFGVLFAGILAATGAALDEAAPGSASRARLLQATDRAEQAVTFLTQLMVLGRRHKPALEKVDLAALCARLRDPLRGLLGPAIALRLDVEPTLWPVQGDPAHLERALLLLATAAREAMPGGGSWAIHARNFSPATGAAQVEVTLHDTGPSLSAQAVARLFEPYFAARPGHGGTLGLAVAQALLRQGGGRLEAGSSAAGTTFRLLLPADRAADSARASGPPPCAPVLLLVEDEPLVMRVASRLLAAGGYRVLEAPDGPAALACAAANQGQIAALVTDVRMRPMDGVALSRTLRESNPQLPVVFVSGYPEEADNARGPGTWFVQKPFTRSTLLGAVQSAISLKDAASPGS